MSPIIAGIAAVFSVAAFVFYVIAASGYSKNYKVLKDCQWFYYDGKLLLTFTDDDYYYAKTDDDYGKEHNVDSKLYFGLKGVSISVSLGNYRQFYHYDSDFFNDDSNITDKCDSPGKSAFA